MRIVHSSVLPLLVVLSLGTVGCEAFNDHPQEQEMMQLAIAENPPVEEPAVEAPAETPTVGTVDYSSDSSQCVQSSGLVVKKSEIAVSANSGWTTDGANQAATVSVERIGAFTLKYTLSKSTGATAETLSFTVKQTSETDYVACNVEYKNGDAEYKLASGTITVDQFDKKADGVTTGIGANSGTYDLVFDPSGSATSAAAVLAGARATTASVIVAGTYVTEAVTE